MNDFKYFHKIYESLIQSQDTIVFKPNYKDIHDFPYIFLKSTSKSIVTAAVHKLCFPNKPFQELMSIQHDNTDICYLKNSMFFQFPISNSDFKTLIIIIKNIVQQQCPDNNQKRHTIILSFQEVLKPHFIPPIKNIIQNYTHNCLFILTGKVPFSIHTSGVAISCTISSKHILDYINIDQQINVTCPMQLCAKLQGISLNTTRDFIEKNIKEILKNKKYEQIKTFSYKILASGIPINKFCHYLIDIVPKYIHIISEFEYSVINSTKPIFHMESLLLKMCLD